MASQELADSGSRWGAEPDFREAGKTKRLKKKSMKLRTIKCLGLGLAVAAGLATAAKAQIIDYSWVQDTTSLQNYSSVGSIVYDVATHTVLTISFSESLGAVTETVLNFVPSATTVVLPPGVPNGDLQLTGQSSNATGGAGGSPFYLYWAPNPVGGTVSGPSEQLTFDNTTLTGAWVSAVPEPTTMMAGVLLLLPFAASTLRFARKSRAA